MPLPPSINSLLEMHSTVWDIEPKQVTNIVSVRRQVSKMYIGLRSEDPGTYVKCC